MTKMKLKVKSNKHTFSCRLKDHITRTLDVGTVWTHQVSRLSEKKSKTPLTDVTVSPTDYFY